MGKVFCIRTFIASWSKMFKSIELKLAIIWGEHDHYQLSVRVMLFKLSFYAELKRKEKTLDTGWVV